MNTLYSYIDNATGYQVTIAEEAPEGIVVTVRDMLDASANIRKVRIPKDDIPELAYVFLALTNEIVSPKQKLLQ